MRITFEEAGAVAVDAAEQQGETADAFAALYPSHYPSLVRLAVVLLHDSSAAEDLVQDAFVHVAARRRVVRDGDYGVSYLRRAVVNAARSQWRRRVVASRKFPVLAASVPSVDESAYRRFEHLDVIAELRKLPRRQREVVTLRYLEDLPEADVANILGISPGAVKRYAHNGLVRLRESMENSDEEP